MTEKKWFVEIVEFDTNKVVKRIECEYERKAEKVESGVLINLNHDKFFTRVVEE